MDRCDPGRGEYSRDESRLVVIGVMEYTASGPIRRGGAADDFINDKTMMLCPINKADAADREKEDSRRAAGNR